MISLCGNSKIIELLKVAGIKLIILNSKISIRHRKNTDMCCVRMVSAHLCESLSKYGIVENKTELYGQ